MDKNTASKTKIVSIVISLGIIATLIIGVISVVRSVNKNRISDYPNAQGRRGTKVFCGLLR